jgi:hypothetical protein
MVSGSILNGILIVWDRVFFILRGTITDQNHSLGYHQQIMCSVPNVQSSLYNNTSENYITFEQNQVNTQYFLPIQCCL